MTFGRRRANLGARFSINRRQALYALGGSALAMTMPATNTQSQSATPPGPLIRRPIPKAKGAASRLQQEADGYRQRVISTAEGDATRFKQVLAEYSKAPQVTREQVLAMVERLAARLKDHPDDAEGWTMLGKSYGVMGRFADMLKASAKHPAMLFVDGVSSIGSLEFKMDEWGVDVIVAGSQKGFMLPAGLLLMAASPKAIEKGKTNKGRRAYFEFQDMIAQNANGYFPYTPSVPLLYGLKEALAILFEEGLDQVYKRHHHLGEGVRAAVAAWGLKTCAKEPKWNSDTVTAIVVPEGFDAAKVIETAYKRYNLALGAGLSEVAGKVFRIGHLGDTNDLTIMGALSGVEMGLGLARVPHKAGGAQAALTYLRDTAPGARHK